MEENNGINVEKSKKNDVKRMLLIVIGICFMGVVLWNTINSKIKSENAKKEADKYLQEIEEYLQDEYDEKFNIEFVKKGYKKKSADIGDGSQSYFGSDKNVVEYLYRFNPKGNEEIECFIAYWYEKNTGKSEVSELFYPKQVSGKNNNFTYYKEYIEDNKAVEIKEKLDDYLGYGYTIEAHTKNATNSIRVTSDKKWSDIILENKNKFLNLSDNISKLIEKKYNTDIILYYKDYTIGFSFRGTVWMTSSYEYSYLEDYSFDSINEFISFVKNK